MKNLKPSQTRAGNNFPGLKWIITCALIFIFAVSSFAQTAWTTLANGGPDDLGSIGHYDISTSTWTTDHLFTSSFPGNISGDNSMTELNGKFYGISSMGGTSNMGLIFEWDPNTSEYTVLYFGSYDNGSYPRGKLLPHNGKLYGVADGGINNHGVIFEIDPSTHVYSKKIELYNYPTGGNGVSQMAYFNGKFYGQTQNGGANDFGTIFEWDPSTNVFTVKHSFSLQEANSSTFTLYNDKFYGMILTATGSSNVSSMYSWDPSTNDYHIYTGSTISGISSGVSVNEDKLYGIGYTHMGGQGFLFEWDPASQTFTNEKFIPCVSSCSESSRPLSIDGEVYLQIWGHENDGALLRFNPGTDELQEVINFNSTDVARPGGQFLLKDSKYYALSSGGGSANKGTLYTWDPNTNDIEIKISFGESLQGAHPQGSLAYVNGKFYGMTSEAGESNHGTLFEWNPVAGTYTKLHDFDGISGSNPQGGLFHSDGKLYGMTKNGGSHNGGVIFRWDLATSTFSKIHDFDCSTGCNPFGELTMADGKFYGMTQNGGVNGATYCAGVIFEWDPVAGTYLSKFNFSKTDGGHATGSLTYLDGKLYGLTYYGGASAIGGNAGYGVIFQYDVVSGTYTKKIDLDIYSGHPSGSLTYHDGKFYGLSEIANYGSIFSWDPANNQFVKRHTFFPPENGAVPRGTLTYFNNVFYGVTSSGGESPDQNGVLFSWSPSSGEYNKKMAFNKQTGTTPGLVQLVLTETAPFQYITFANLPALHYASAPFVLTATASSGLPVQYSSSNETVATIEDNAITIHSLGETTITASQPGNEVYAPATDVHQTLTIGKAPLAATAENKSRAAGQPNPPLTISYAGFKAGENISVVDVLPTASTTANTASSPGVYPIVVEGGSDDHYDIIPFKGYLTVTGPMPYVYVTSPTNGKTNQKIKLDIISKTVAGATTYTIEISPEMDFTSGVISENGGSTLSFDSLEYSTTYYARVKTNLEPGYGKITSFTTVGASYYSVVNSPSNGATNVRLNPTIVANNVLRASVYTIELNTDPTFNPGTALVKSGGASLNFGALQPNTVYYSRVKTDLDDVWGATRTFTTTSAEAAAYVTSPSNGAINQNANLNIVSNEVPGATSYTIQVSTQHDFSTIAYENSSSQRSIPFQLQYNETYYARVSTDLSSTFGAVGSFSTKDASRDTYITTPVDGATNVRYLTNITVRNIQGASTYTVELNTASDFSGASIINTGPTSQLAFSLAYDQRYYARAKTDVSPLWGPQQQFTTGNPVSLCSIVSIVGNNQPAPGLWSISFVAAQIPGASQYTIEVSTSSDFTGSTKIKSSPYRSIRFDDLATYTNYYIRASTNLAPGQFGPVREFYTGVFGGARMAVHDEMDKSMAELLKSDAYPNPFTDRLNVYVETPVQESITIGLVDVTGRPVHQSIGLSNTHHEIQTLVTPGVYVLTIQTSGRTKTMKVTKIN